jgi:hypothetical protein
MDLNSGVLIILSFVKICSVLKKLYVREHTVTDLINALPDNSSVNTVQHARIDEAVLSMSSVPSSCGTMVFYNPFLNNGSVNTLPRKR